MKFYNPFKRIRDLNSTIAELRTDVRYHSHMSEYYATGRSAYRRDFLDRTVKLNQLDQAVMAHMDERQDLQDLIDRQNVAGAALIGIVLEQAETIAAQAAELDDMEAGLAGAISVMVSEGLLTVA